MKSYLGYTVVGTFGAICGSQCNIVVNTFETCVISASLDTIFVWEVKSKKCIFNFCANDPSSVNCAYVTCLALFPGEAIDILAAGATDGSIRVWSLVSNNRNSYETFSLRTTLLGHQKSISALIYSSRGDHLCSGSRDGDIIVWDLVYETGICRLRRKGTGEVNWLGFIEKNKIAENILLSSGYRENVSFEKLKASKEHLALADVKSSTEKVILFILVLTGGSVLTLWNVNLELPISSLTIASVKGLTCCTLHPFKDVVLVADSSGIIRVYNFSTNEDLTFEDKFGKKCINYIGSFRSPCGARKITEMAFFMCSKKSNNKNEISEMKQSLFLDFDLGLICICGGTKIMCVFSISKFQTHIRKMKLRLKRRLVKKKRKMNEILNVIETKRQIKSLQFYRSENIIDTSSNIDLTSNTHQFQSGPEYFEKHNLENEIKFIKKTIKKSFENFNELILWNDNFLQKDFIKDLKNNDVQKNDSFQCDSLVYNLEDEYNSIGMYYTTSKIRSVSFSLNYNPFFFDESSYIFYNTKALIKGHDIFFPVFFLSLYDNRIKIFSDLILFQNLMNSQKHLLLDSNSRCSSKKKNKKQKISHDQQSFSEEKSNERQTCVQSSQLEDHHRILEDSPLIKISDNESNETDMIESFGHRSNILFLVLSPDDLYLATGSKDSVIIWHTPSNTPIQRLLVTSTTSAFFLAGNEDLILCDENGSVFIYNISSGGIGYSCISHEGVITDMKPDGLHSCFATTSKDKSVCLHDLFISKKESGSGEVFFKLRKKQILQDEGISVAFSNSGSLVCVSLLDGTIFVFFKDSMKTSFILYGHSLPALTIAISTDDRFICSGGHDKTLKIWNLDYGDLARSLNAHSEPITKVAWVRATHYVASSSLDGSVKLWDIDHFSLALYINPYVLNMYIHPIYSFIFSKDSAFAFVVLAGKCVRLYNRTSSPVFSSEEQENREVIRASTTVLNDKICDQIFDDRFADPDAVVMKRPTVPSFVTLQSAEILMQVIDETFEGLKCLNKYKSDVSEFEAKQLEKDNTDSIFNKLSVPFQQPQLPELPKELMGRSPHEHILMSIENIPNNKIYEMLCSLSFLYAERLLSFVADILDFFPIHNLEKNGSSEFKNCIKNESFLNEDIVYPVEGLCKVALTLIQIHFRQLQSNRGCHGMLNRLRGKMRFLLNSRKEGLCYSGNALTYIKNALRV